MTKLPLCLPFLALLPLAAQDWEVSVSALQQTYHGPGLAAPFVDVTTGAPSSRTVYALRLGRSVLDLGPAQLQITAGYQPQSSATVTSSENLGGYNQAATTTSFKTQNVSLGAMVNLIALVTAGAGLECRFESYDFQGQTVTATRPWVRANLGVQFPSPVVKPFVGLEVAYPLTSTKVGDGTDLDALIRAMAPKGQVGVYGGLRF